jgi:hypothetical protein
MVNLYPALFTPLVIFILLVIFFSEWTKEGAKEYDKRILRVLLNATARIVDIFGIGLAVALLLKL